MKGKKLMTEAKWKKISGKEGGGGAGEHKVKPEGEEVAHREQWMEAKLTGRKPSVGSYM